MTATSKSPDVAATPRRQADLTLARAHLRLGSLGLARAELEIMAGTGDLDGAGRVDLAEVRWRTGDLARAGEAALEALAIVGDEPVALIIAAEAASALGRPSEARRLATRAMDCLAGPIDAVFAGMPRSAVWPADAAEPPPTATTLFQQDPIAPQIRRAGDSETFVASTLRAPTSEAAATGPTGRGSSTPGFWDVDPGAEPVAPGLPDPVEELEAAARALLAGSLEEAALRFALTLRLAPALAPAVLEATEVAVGTNGAAGSTGPAGAGLSVVRGDAFRLVGLEVEARRAFAMAAWSGARDRRRAATPEPAAPAVSDTIRPVPRTRTQGRHARH